MGVDHGGGGRRDKSPPQNLERGIVPQILSYCKILSTRLLALQCRKMCFLPLQQDFYSNIAICVPPEFQSDLRLCFWGLRRQNPARATGAPPTPTPQGDFRPETSNLPTPGKYPAGAHASLQVDTAANTNNLLVCGRGCCC